MVQDKNLGGGIALNKDFDLEIDSRGDIKTVTGVEEVKKDLAYNMAEALQDIVGNSKDTDTAYETKRVCEETVDSYDNVSNIKSLRVEFGSFSDSYDISVGFIVQINDEPKDMVVTV
jgi:hypothetical protein